MYKKPLLLEAFLLAIVIAALHLLALKFYLYWIISWTDVVMHFLGGFWLAIFGLYLFFVMRVIRLPMDSKTNIAFVTFSFVLLVGLAWELWELFSGLTFVLRDRVDTIVDLVVDLIGGIAGFFYGINKVWQKKD